MEDSSGRFKDKVNLKISLIFLALCIILVAAAFIVGIDDNVPGVTLLYLGSLALILIFVHSWREAKKFGYLVLGSVIGLIIFAVVHNFMEVAGQTYTDIAILSYLMIGLGVLTFFLALMICPAAIVIGIIGAVVAGFKSKRGEKG